MNDTARILRVVLLAAAAAALAAAALQLREKKQSADLIVAEIEDRLAQLDPVTRAAVVAELTANATKRVRAMHG
ncbi:MAG TPA: hypothetical protein VIM19_06785 [Actinomycetes bacterium]